MRISWIQEAWCKTGLFERAREKGFMVTKTGKGGLQNVLDDIAGRELKFLRLAGEKMIDLDRPKGIEIDTRVVYRTRALQMSPSVSSVFSATVWSARTVLRSSCLSSDGATAKILTMTRPAS